MYVKMKYFCQEYFDTFLDVSVGVWNVFEYFRMLLPGGDIQFLHCSCYNTDGVVLL